MKRWVSIPVMRQKWTFGVFVLLVVLCFIMAGCRSYNVRLLSVGSSIADTASVAQASEEFKGRASFQRAEASRELTVSFEGTEYTGTYRDSSRGKGAMTVLDHYEVGSGPVRLVFSVDSSDRKLAAVTLRVDSSEELKLPMLGADETEAKAREYASMWVSLSEYELTESSVRTRSSHADYHYYRFCKKACGIETTDWVDVLISDRGVLHYMETMGLGWVNQHQAELNAFPLSAAVKAAEKASGLASPTVGVRRFGISADGKVFLIVTLSGASNEALMELAVTVD